MRGKLGLVSRVQLPRVAMLLHMDGGNGSTTFTDSSLNSLSVVRSGATLPIISTAVARAGFGAHGSFPGNNAKVSAVSNDFVFSRDNFTVECFFRVTDLTDFRFIFGSTGFGVDGFDVSITPNGSLVLFGADGASLLSSVASLVVINTWYHIAVCRIAGVTTLFLNGTSRGVYSDSSQNYIRSNYTSNTFVVGHGRTDGGSSQSFVGQIDEFRAFNKFGVYPGAFATPSAPFPNP